MNLGTKIRPNQRGMQVQHTRVDFYSPGYSTHLKDRDALASILRRAEKIRQEAVSRYGLYVCCCGFQAPGTRVGWERAPHQCGLRAA